MNEEQSLASGISILVSVIAFTVWCYWDSIKEFFGVRREVIRLENTVDQLGTELERKAQEIWCAEQAEQDSARMYKELRAQLMQVRVSQSTTQRAGWEVMCFIPEEALRMMPENYILDKVARELVRLAREGIIRVRANGTCCALVFEPLNLKEPARAPRFVQALWDQGGKFKLSEKCWDQRSNEQRARNASGVEGFGV
jgi:hypothetical protein